MVYNELRKDYLLDRWVVIAKERSRRPSDFVRKNPGMTQSLVCPLCVGNEHLTPPAVMLYLDQNGRIEKTKDRNGIRSKNWLIRVIPNLFPAFTFNESPNSQEEIRNQTVLRNAVGHHEVLVESPKHDEDPADANLTQLEFLIEAYIDRLRELSGKSYVEYISIFRNYGREAGASLTHAHSQIITTPFVPRIPAEELMTSKKHYEERKKCIFCDIIKNESSNSRLILERENFLVFTPYASVHPLEFWIFPKNHAQNPLNLNKKEVEDFAITLKTSLKALKTLVNDPPYNYGIHLSINDEDRDYYHWHLEVYPRLSIWAGFEKNTGMYINTITPEIAATELRKMIDS